MTCHPFFRPLLSFFTVGSCLLLAFALALASTVTRATADEVSPEIAKARLLGDDFVVTSLGDSGPGTLRQAILDARTASPDGSVITFAPNLNGKTIELSSAPLFVSAGAPPLEISAGGLSKGLTIDARQNSRVFFFSGFTYVHLDNLTITGGTTPDIDQPGVLAQPGGGMVALGTSTTLVDCLVTANKTGSNPATDGLGGPGGGIYHADGTLRLIRTSVTANVTGNGHRFGGHGGGIYNEISSSLVLVNSTIDDNRTGNGTVDGGNGGGINNFGILSVEGSTISRNTTGDGGRDSGWGGGIMNEGEGTFTNSTIAMNATGNAGTGSGQGGGIWTYILGSGNISHCTVADNETGDLGGGVFVNSTGGGAWASKTT